MIVDGEAGLVELARHSHRVITTHQHPGGAYPAAPYFSAYRGYAWLRDGSFTAEGISRYGDAASADRFHDWISRVLAGRRSHVDALLGRTDPPDAAMLPARFTFDGGDGADPWWDFQTDGYGSWLWSVATHVCRHGSDPGRWRPGIEVAIDYLARFWDRPCFDWWEEHDEHRHVSTLGAIRGGLVAIAPYADPARAATCHDTARRIEELVLADGVSGGHLVKWLGATTVDGSLPACVVPFGLVSGSLADATVDAVAGQLDAGGGVHRFGADVFYGGGQWPLLSALLGWNLAARGDRDGALRHLRWVAAQARPDGDLPEQAGHHLLHPAHRAEWVERWGEVATPLLWSHGMYLILASELGLLP